MIVLKILLWILLAVLGLILVVLMLPISARVSFMGGKFTFMVKYAGLPVLGSGGRGILSKLKKKKKKPKKKKDPPEKEKKKDEKAEAADNADNAGFLENTAKAEEKADPVKDETAELTADAGDTPDADTPDDTEDISDILDGIDDETKDEAKKEAKAEKKKKRRKKKDDIDYDKALEEFYDDEKDEKDEKGGKSKKKEPRSLEDKIEFILDIWGAANRPLLKIFKGFKFSELYIDFIIANEDAYKCALRYGKICAVVYNLLGVMGTLCNVKFKTVDINPGFSLKKGRYDFGVKLSFCPIVVVIAGLWFLVTYIFRVLLPNKMRKKSAARQK